MELSTEKLKEVLVEPGFITEADFKSAQKEAEEENKPLKEVLLEKDLITDENLGRVIAEELGYNFVNLREETIPEEIIKIVPELVAKMQQVIVFDKTKEGLKVAMANPGNFEMIDWLGRKTGEEIIPYYATSKDIRGALKYYRKELKKAFEEIIKTQVQLAEEGKAKAEDVPIIKIVDTLIEYAYENRASDIHIEPLETESQVRFRIDGILHNVLVLPKSIHGLIVTRVKVLAKLRTDEHFAAQDGKLVVRFEKERFDIRVSIVPVTEGENIVMRLLAERARRFALETLGFSDRDLKKVKNSIKKPYGMILATGPTGCGKTTTLYAILKILNKPEVNICTIEDPVEYDIGGVSQIQVNPKTNLTFAQGLRSIVRQDPDIMMVGEIRDNETANIGINSAMTGHLVLSTMHANTAATNLIRLMDMGIEPFLIASSVNVIIAQRLVRRICTRCRESYETTRDKFKKLNLSQDLIEKFFKGKEKIRLYRGKGCKVCVNTGYSGRVGIFEVLEMEDNIRELVMKKANADQIQAQAVKNGMTTVLEDGIEKALSGITTTEEVIRVTRE
ncbi:MAG: GspE/PulE family protein [Candidatus Aminicenantia bacterium]